MATQYKVKYKITVKRNHADGPPANFFITKDDEIYLGPLPYDKAERIVRALNLLEEIDALPTEMQRIIHSEGFVELLKLIFGLNDHLDIIRKQEEGQL